MSDFNLENECSMENSSLNHYVEFILNAFLHVGILFAFLVILMNVVIVPEASKAFRKEFGHQIDDNLDKLIPQRIDLRKYKKEPLAKKRAITQLLSNLKNLEKYGIKVNPEDQETVNTGIKYFDMVYNYFIRQDILQNYIIQYANPNFAIDQHNKAILHLGTSTAWYILIITFVLICAIKIACPDCFSITKLFTENLLTFAVIGVVEYWFFTNYALKYIPAPPSLLVSSIINDIKDLLSKSNFPEYIPKEGDEDINFEFTPDKTIFNILNINDINTILSDDSLTLEEKIRLIGQRAQQNNNNTQRTQENTLVELASLLTSKAPASEISQKLNTINNTDNDNSITSSTIYNLLTGGTSTGTTTNQFDTSNLNNTLNQLNTNQGSLQ